MARKMLLNNYTNIHINKDLSPRSSLRLINKHFIIASFYRDELFKKDNCSAEAENEYVVKNLVVTSTLYRSFILISRHTDVGK